MVQLSPSPPPGVSPPPCRPPGRPQEEEEEEEEADGDREDCGGLEVSTAYHGYDTYIEDGLICLKHKIRNMEKRKLKLEDYTKRLKQGDDLNKDQTEAVGKHEELLHNLAFAREMHRTLDGLTQNMLKAQKKAAKREQVAQMEAERRRLGMVLQVQHLLYSLQQDHIRTDLLAGHHQAPHVPASRLHSLLQLAALLGVKRNDRLSLEEQMEEASLVYLDLLDGRDKLVAGSTFKLMKEELTRLLRCDYFSFPPPPPPPPPPTPPSPASNKTAVLPVLSGLVKLPKPETNELSRKESLTRPRTAHTVESPPGQTHKADIMRALREREPPDSWDMEPESPGPPRTPVQKPWRGAATLIPKTKKEAPGAKQQRKVRKGKRNSKATISTDAPVEVFDSPSDLPKDPILRKQLLDDLMTKIHGSFSFMQDSLLEGDGSPGNAHVRLGRRASGSPSPLAKRGVSRSPAVTPPEMLQSTPFAGKRKERKASLTNGDQSLESCDLKLSTGELSHESQGEGDQTFALPPLYRRESTVSVGLEDRSRPLSPCGGVTPRSSTPTQGRSFSTPPTRRTLTPAQFQNMHSVSKVNGEMNYKPESAAFPDVKYNTTSTQTPPEFAPPEDEAQPVFQAEYPGADGQVFLSPGRWGRPGQSYYARGLVRGGYETYRCGIYSPGGSFVPQAQLRDPGPVLYGTRDPGFQHGYRRGAGGVRQSSNGWSDSSQVSSPDREGTFPVVDSGHGDSLSVSTLEVPVTPHGGGSGATLLPVPLYPLSQPLRVAFTASRTANFAPGNLDQPVVFDQLHSNLGDMYDGRLGRFTCPATGAYVFLFSILKLAVSTPLYINLMRNDEVMVSAYANDGAPDHETASNHAILPLYQGDQVWLRLHRGAIYGSTWKYSTFSGFLLYQD